MRHYNSLEKKKRAYRYLSEQSAIKNAEVLLFVELGLEKKLNYRGYDAYEGCNEATDFLELGSTFVEHYSKNYIGCDGADTYNYGKRLFEPEEDFDEGFEEDFDEGFEDDFEDDFEDEEVIDLSDCTFSYNYIYNL